MTYQPALSPSRAKEYLQCPLKFRFSVVDRLSQPPTIATAKGTLVHAVLENLYSEPAVKRNNSTAQDMLIPQWDILEAQHPEYAELFSPQHTKQELIEDSRKLLEQYFSLEQPENIQPYACESRIETQLDSGLHLRGIVDRIDRAPDGRTRVIDYKTGNAPKPRFMDDALFQMKFYALMLNQVDVLPTRMQLLYLKSGSVLTLDPLVEDITRFESQLNQIWERIEADANSENFAPRKTALCGWCNFQELCPFYGGKTAGPSQNDLNRLRTMRS